jgi:hypothetical protein
VQGNTAIFPESVDFTDGRFAVRLEGPTASSLSPGDLATAQRRSRFAGARIRISDLNEPDSAAFFWPTPEDIVETPPAWPMSRQGRTSPRRWSVTSTTFPDYRRAPAKMRSLRMKANLYRNPWT